MTKRRHGYPMSPQQAQNLYQYGGAAQDGNAVPAGYTYHEGKLVPGTDYAAGQSQQWTPGTGGTTATPSTNSLLTNPWTGTNAGMPLPNQISPRAYANSYAYQRELGWAGYEDAGWDKALAQEAFDGGHDLPAAIAKEGLTWVGGSPSSRR